MKPYQKVLSDGTKNLRGQRIRVPKMRNISGVVVTRTQGSRWAVDLANGIRCTLDRSEFTLERRS